MTVWEALAILAAGFAAGGINAVVGSGSLITFPVLVALGYPSVQANVSNTVGLVPGGVSGTLGYRRELRGQGRRAATLSAGTFAGALAGGILLLALPSKVFDVVVPVLILVAVGLMATRPAPRTHGPRREHVALGTFGSFLTGVKNVLATLANLVAALLFVVVADPAWGASALIAAGSIAGAHLGARYGRRLPQEWLRRIVIVGGTAVAILLFI